MNTLLDKPAVRNGDDILNDTALLSRVSDVLRRDLRHPIFAADVQAWLSDYFLLGGDEEDLAGALAFIADPLSLAGVWEQWVDDRKWEGMSYSEQSKYLRNDKWGVL